MAENPRFDKKIHRGRNEVLVVHGIEGKVNYTDSLQDVPGGNNVKCQTWEIVGIKSKVDGADIEIGAGGWTPIQKVNGVEVVIDTPESGEAICVVTDTDGQIYINHFSDEERGQMEFTQGMYICWIAKRDVKLTEFESPAFSDGMFTNIDEEDVGSYDAKLQEYIKVVQGLRG